MGLVSVLVVLRLSIRFVSTGVLSWFLVSLWLGFYLYR